MLKWLKSTNKPIPEVVEVKEETAEELFHKQTDQVKEAICEFLCDKENEYTFLTKQVKAWEDDYYVITPHFVCLRHCNGLVEGVYEYTTRERRGVCKRMEQKRIIQAIADDISNHSKHLAWHEHHKKEIELQRKDLNSFIKTVCKGEKCNECDDAVE